jgi:hypothetical protein
MTVLDFTKYMDREAFRRLEGKVNLPRVYNIRLEVLENSGVYHLEYHVSNKKLSETVTGREMLFDQLTMIIMSMCNDDPALILELEQSLEAYFFGNDEEDEE